jgi:hypothetical protein
VELELSAEDLAFRDAVRAFLAARLTPALAQAGRRMTSVFCDKATAWPGRRSCTPRAGPRRAGRSSTAARLDRDAAPRLRAECARAGAPSLAPMGLKMVAPAIMAFGTPAEGLLPAAHPVGRGLLVPGLFRAGRGVGPGGPALRADGRRRRLRAERLEDLDHPRPLGQPHVLPGPHIDRGQAAGRDHLPADRHGPPGISVKPIVTLAGEHEVNQVFFDDVRTPVADRLGEENQGWTVAKHLLTFERGGGYAPGLEAMLAPLANLGRAGGRRRDRPAARRPAPSPPPGGGRDRDPGHRHLRAPGAQRPGRRRQSRAGLVDAQAAGVRSPPAPGRTGRRRWAPMSPRTSLRRARPARTWRRSAPSTA